MTDVFISYAREDGEFVRRLHAALEAADRESWVDWEGIPPTAEWMKEIHEAIEAADTFVAVLSRHSVASEVCGAETAYAEGQGKRLVPIVVEDVAPEDTPEELARLNWLFFRPGDDFDASLALLVEALDTDLEHLKLHTWVLVRCQRWLRGGEDASSLLRGSELQTAESWLAGSEGREPVPTPVQTRFLVESRRQQARRQRRLMVGVAAALVVSITLGALAWVQRGRAIEARDEANRQRDLAVARSLATSSELALDETGDGLVRSTLLAVESLRRVATTEGEAAWERAMDLLPPPPLVESEALGEVTAAALSPDGRLWAAGSAEGEVAVGSVVDGAVIDSWTAVDSAVSTLAFSHDARLLAVGGQQVAAVWELAEMRRVGELREPGTLVEDFGIVRSAAFSRSDDRLYLAAEGYGVEVVSADGWRRVRPLPTPESRAFELALHPRRDLLVAGGFGLTLFDLAEGSGRQIADARREEVDALAFSPEGWELASSDFAVRIWDLDESDDGAVDLLPADRLVPSDDRVLALDLSAAGRYLAVGREAGTAHLLTAKTGEELDRVVGSAPVHAVGLDTEGGRLLTISDRFRAWRAIAGAEVHRADLGSKVASAFFVADGSWLVARTAARQLRFFDPDGLEPRHALDLAPGPSVAVSADGRWLAAVGREKLTVLDTASLEARAELRLEGARVGLAFSPDSRLMAAAGDGVAAMLDLESLAWRELEAEPDRRLMGPGFSEAGEWLVLRVGRETQLFRRPAWVPLPPVRGEILSLSPDGATVCTRIAPRRGLHLGLDFAWEAATGRELGSVGLEPYQGRSAREFGSGDIDLAERCAEWPQLEVASAAEPELGESPRWRVAARETAVLLFARRPEDRIAEACRRVPRQLTPEEWSRFLPDEPFRPSCGAL